MPGLDYNTLVVLVGTVALGIAAGVTGSLALLRRRSLLADALAHATLPGVCLAYLWTGERSLPVLLCGALLSGLLGVVIVSWLPRVTRIRTDAAIGLVLGVFFGIGIALSGHIQRTVTDASQAGLDSLLLGRTAGMLFNDTVAIGVASLAVIGVVFFLRKEFLISCFDPGFGEVEGWPVLALDLLQLFLLAVTVVLALPAVGVVLTAAMLVIPAVSARLWVDRFGILMILAAIIGGATGGLGTLLSARFESLPAGPVIVLVSSSLFIISLLCAPRRGVIARALRSRSRTLNRETRRLLALLLEAKSRGKNTVPHSHLLGRERSVRRRSLDSAIARGWVQLDGDGISLTEGGHQRALRGRRALQLWHAYLEDAASIDRDLVDLDEEQIEKILPAEKVLELERLLSSRTEGGDG